MRVNQVMTHGAECIRPSTTLREAAERMRQLDVGFLPVCGPSDQLIGMLTDRDIIIRAVADGQDTNIVQAQDVLSPEVIYCYEDQDVADAAEVMKENQVRRLVVLDRDKRLVGIVSLGDLAIETRDDHLVGDTVEAVCEPTGKPR